MLRLTPDRVNEHLRHCVYARIQRSPIHGIGIFAIRDIPQGIDPFSEKDLDLQFIKIPADQIEDDPGIPEGVKRYVRDVSSNVDGIRNFPANGFNSISAAFLMNHSDNANVGHDEYGHSITLRDIKEGEELTLNYGMFNDESELKF